MASPIDSFARFFRHHSYRGSGGRSCCHGFRNIGNRRDFFQKAFGVKPDSIFPFDRCGWTRMGEPMDCPSGFDARGAMQAVCIIIVIVIVLLLLLSPGQRSGADRIHHSPPKTTCDLLGVKLNRTAESGGARTYIEQ